MRNIKDMKNIKNNRYSKIMRNIKDMKNIKNN